jgi:hypothetical protein
VGNGAVGNGAAGNSTTCTQDAGTFADVAVQVSPRRLRPPGSELVWPMWRLRPPAVTIPSGSELPWPMWRPTAAHVSHHTSPVTQPDSASVSTFSSDALCHETGSVGSGSSWLGVSAHGSPSRSLSP